MSRQLILLVEDEKDIAYLISRNLEKEGFKTIIALNLQEAIDILEQNSPHLIILDLMLPDGDGLEVCRYLKFHKYGDNVGVIILTAKGGEEDRILGFEFGADDYIVKPFSPRELVLRVKAVLRRLKKDTGGETFRFGDLFIDEARHEIYIKGEPIRLTRTEFALLIALLKADGKVLTREILLDQVWGYSFDGYARTVDTHIRRLRKKLGPCASFIETVWGLGYRFNIK